MSDHDTTAFHGDRCEHGDHHERATASCVPPVGELWIQSTRDLVEIRHGRPCPGHRTARPVGRTDCPGSRTALGAKTVIFALGRVARALQLRAPVLTTVASERPRERLLERGADALASSELLAVILGTGVAGRSATELGSRLLEHAGQPGRVIAR
jgi:hypothetical protein